MKKTATNLRLVAKEDPFALGMRAAKALYDVLEHEHIDVKRKTLEETLEFLARQKAAESPTESRPGFMPHNYLIVAEEETPQGYKRFTNIVIEKRYNILRVSTLSGNLELAIRAVLDSASGEVEYFPNE